MGPIGVLSLQGDFREHLSSLAQIGVESRKVKKPSDLTGLSGLIIPGGESTVLDKLTKIYGLAEPLKAAIRGGLPVFGTCAGLIMLADRIIDGVKGQGTLGGLDVAVRRNAFGSQLDSFEAQVPFESTIVSGAFIRAPIVETIGSGVAVLSTLPDGRVVAVRQGNLLGISFHPEVTGDTQVHQYFVNMCKRANFIVSN